MAFQSITVNDNEVFINTDNISWYKQNPDHVDADNNSKPTTTIVMNDGSHFSVDGIMSF